MRLLIIAAFVSIAFSAYSQPARDSNSRDDQNAQGANTAAGEMDPATKARVRTEGVPGGTGAHIPPEASGGATVGNGSQHRHSPPKPPDPQQQGEARDEKSSSHDEGGGARGPAR